MEKTKPLDANDPSRVTFIAFDNELLSAYDKSLKVHRTHINVNKLYLNVTKSSDSLTDTFKKSFSSLSKAYAQDKREGWYDLICSNRFKPKFDSESGVSFFTSHEEADTHRLPYRIIEELVSSHIFRAAENENSEESLASVTNNLLMACTQLLRYLPEFENRRPRFFIDTHSPKSKLGVVFQKHGTLTILVSDNSEIEYSYAHKQAVGTVRISGTAKLTKDIQNSKIIRKLLRLQGMPE